jgi:hypothetical protein
MVFSLEKDRHTVMDVRQKCICRRCNDRTRFDEFPLRVLTSVPDSSERKDRAVRERKAKGRLPLAGFRPLLKSVGGNQTAAGQQGFAEGGLPGNRLGPRVNHFVAGFGILRPERD